MAAKIVSTLLPTVIEYENSSDGLFTSFNPLLLCGELELRPTHIILPLSFSPTDRARINCWV